MPRARPRFAAARRTQNGVNLYIDGVGQKGYVRSGVSGQAGDTQGNPFPQLAIGEYKVITSNYKAEYDQISSAAITAISRSGTNEFDGQAFGTYSADNWRAMTPAERTTGIKTESETKEYGFPSADPIIGDKMHFFLAYEAQALPDAGHRGYWRQHSAGHRGAVAAGCLMHNLGPATIGFDEDLYFAKLDWEFSDFDRRRPVGEDSRRNR